MVPLSSRGISPDAGPDLRASLAFVPRTDTIYRKAARAGNVGDNSPVSLFKKVSILIRKLLKKFSNR
jgi:hypothetical protein